MSDINTVLEPAVVSCPRPLPSTAAHACEFTLNIGIFMDGTDNNKENREKPEIPSASTHTNAGQLGNVCCDAPRKRGLQTWIRYLSTSLAVMCTATLMAACASGANGVKDLVPKKDMVGVSIAGIGHLGLMVGIPEFFVNGQWGGNNSGWGGGGGGVCCVKLPSKVVQPMIVKVTWQTCDISGIKFVNDRIVDPTQQCKLDAHEASVPIHFAVEPGKGGSGLYVHFLPGNKVEVWYANPYPESSAYPGPKYPRGLAPAYAPLPDEQPLPSASERQSK